MERGPRSLHSRQTSAVFSNACKAKASYDDVFGGPTKYEFSSFPPREEEYSEIFGRFRLSRASSIPSLDLPAVDESVISFDVLDSHFDYSEVFDRCNALGFAVTYVELLKPSNRDESSDEAWTPAESEYLSEESDPSAYDAFDEITSDEDCNISYCDAKEYDYSYQSVNQRSDMYVHNRMKDLSRICLPSEFLFSETEKSYLLKAWENKLSGKVSDVSLTLSSSVQSLLRPPTLNSKEEKCGRMQTLDVLPPQVDVGVVVNSSSMPSADSEQLGSLSGNILEEKDIIENNVKDTVLEENVYRSCDIPLCSVIKEVQVGNDFPVTSKRSSFDEYVMFYGKQTEAKLGSPKKSHKMKRGMWNEAAGFYEFIAEDTRGKSSEKSSELVINDNCATERTWGSEHTLHAINAVLRKFDHRETAIDSTSSISELEVNAVANDERHDILNYDETKCHQGRKFLTENKCWKNLEAAKNASEHRLNERQTDMHLDHYKQEDVVCSPISMVVERNVDHNIVREKGEDAVVRIPYNCYMKGGGIIDDLGKRIRDALTWVKTEDSVNSGCVKTEFETTMGKNINTNEVPVGTDEMMPAFSRKVGGYELSKIEQGNRASLVETAKCKEVEKKFVSILTLEDIKNNSKGQEKDEKPYQLREDTKVQNKKSFQKLSSLKETMGLGHTNNPEGEDNVQADSNGPEAFFRTGEGTNSCKPKLTSESCAYLDESVLIRSGADNGVLTIYTTVGAGHMISDEAHKLNVDGKSKLTGIAEVKLGIVENHCKKNIKSSSLAHVVSQAGGCDVIDESAKTVLVNLNFDNVGNKYSCNSEIRPVHSHEKNKNSISDNHVEKVRGTRAVGLTIKQEVGNTEKTPLQKISTLNTESKVMNDKHLSAGRDKEWKQREREFEMNKVDEEREREREREKDRMAVEIGTREARKSGNFDARDAHEAAAEDWQRPPLSTGVEGESAHRRKARLERYQRTAERAENALAEKGMRDLLAQREQAERIRVAESLDANVKRWSSGKEGNLRALLSTLQYILGPESGWQPIPLTGVITTTAVKKAYRKATLCVHPDKLQQRGASIQQKYICEKVFDLLKEAWTKFNPEER